ncbi:NAD-P-binding protein [Trametes meyenii]|nr:NAD-P-binding protein [Trametes meyenii]
MPDLVPSVDTQPRIAIVTGAAQGIGEGIALRFAHDGLDVVVVDLPQARERVDEVVRAIRATGRRALGIFADVSVEADVIAMVDKTVEALGGVDVMVANAGIFSFNPITEVTVEDFDSVMAVNVRGVMLAMKYSARQMIKQGRGGRIIAAASTASKQGILNCPAYSASKFAVRGLVQSAALELREHNITVNAYAPGLIVTPLTSRPEDEANGGPGSTVMKAVGMPSGYKGGMPSDVAELVAYMAKPEAWYVTGQCIGINGGQLMD